MIERRKKSIDDGSPRTRAENDRGVFSPTPELSKTPQLNQMALLKLSGFSFGAVKLPYEFVQPPSPTSLTCDLVGVST
jgi:hypothetical protein